MRYNYVNNVKKAFLRAANRIRSQEAYPLTDDPELAEYIRLQPDDFVRIAEEFGIADVLRYIDYMEKKLRLEDRRG